MGSHSLVRAGAFAAASALALGALVAVFDGWRLASLLAAQNGYDVRAYEVGAAALRQSAVAHSLRESVAPVLACAASALLVALLALRVGAWLALGTLAAPLVAAQLFGLHQQRGWIGGRDCALALCGALALVAVALLGARRQRPWPASIAIVLAAAAPAALWSARELAWRPTELESWLRALASVACAGVGAWLLERRARMAWWSVATLFVASVAAYWAAARPGAPSLHAERPLNVLIIGVDTLRADATSLTGGGPGGRDTTPHLRQFAERAVVFENAVSQAPWTLPAFASMFTGRYPLEHGAHRLTSRLGFEQTTLAEILREAGYRTSAVTSHYYLDKSHGLEQGFEHFDSSNALGHAAVTSERVTDLAIEQLERDDGRPFFVFAHYFDPHYEYRNHAAHAWADGYTGWLREQNDFENLIKIRHLLEAPEVDWLQALYHEDIAFTDAQIGRLLEHVRARGLERDTLIVVVADHGEEFGERGMFGHTISVHAEQLHVPLVVAAPGVSAARVSDVVETRAVFETVLDALGVDVRRTTGAPSLLRGSAAAGSAPTPAYSLVWLDDSQLSWGKRIKAACVREGRWKLVHDVTRGRKFLYDLDNDPGERRDVRSSEPHSAARLEALLDTWLQQQLQARTGNSTAARDRATERALKSLGYL